MDAATDGNGIVTAPVRRRACPHGDRLCPCQDGDGALCNYEGAFVNTGRPTGMCPYCGEIVALRRGLTVHHCSGEGRCPGSEQNSRCAESDGRLLWNGKPNLHFGGADVGTCAEGVST